MRARLYSHRTEIPLNIQSQPSIGDDQLPDPVAHLYRADVLIHHVRIDTIFPGNILPIWIRMESLKIVDILKCGFTIAKESQSNEL